MEPRIRKAESHLLNNVHEIIGAAGMHNWKVTERELIVIKRALAQAEKIRGAAWDPGAAYLSGIMEALHAMQLPIVKKSRGTPSIRSSRKKIL